jgi:hypothetical protein
MESRGTHRETGVMVNRPDIIVKNRRKKICRLIDVAIAADRNVKQKQALKHKSLRIQTQRMCNMICMITPAVTGTGRIVTKD